MKNFISFLFLTLFFFGAIQAQNADIKPCGTADLPPHILDWLRNHQQNPSNYRSQMTEPVYVPVKFHLVGTTQGTGYYAAVDVFRLVCDLNKQYTGVGMQFYIYENFHYINNTTYYAHDYSDGEDMMDDNNVDDVVNVYIVDDPAGACGYFTWSGNAIAIKKSCAGAGETTLAHEMGHFFFLPHTFRNWEGSWEPDGVLVDPIPNSQRERVNGSNCSTTADFFCDTPADYLSYRWNCPYTATFLDPNGTPIAPDQTLFMSYSVDYCQKRFSNEQITAMIAGLFEVRTELLGHPQPTISEIGQSHVLYPGNGSQNVNPNNVLIKWSPAVGATNYYVEVSQFTDLENGTNYSGFVTGTELMLQLDPGVNYFWTVQPLNPGNTCGGRASGAFMTGTTETLYLNTLSLDMPDCHNSTSGNVTLQAGGGTAPYNYQWSNDLSGSTQTGLPPGLYPVTVTDVAGNSNIISINVPQPSAIVGNVIQTDNFTASISVSGGTIPYSIAWSSGETGASAFGLSAGANTVTITDGNGCTLTKNVNSIVIQANVNGIGCFGEVNGNIDLQLFGGTPPYNYTWSTGSNSSMLSNLPEGTYNVTVTDAGGAILHLNYNISEPSLLQTTASVNGNSVTVFANGGVPPYTYVFPSGAFAVPTADVTGFPQGNYEVWVYDFNGCLSIAPFSLFSVGIDQPNANSEIAVYPTFVHKGSQLYIELRGNIFRNEDTFGNIYNSEGKLCNAFTTNIVENGLIQIDTRDLPNGMYFIHLQSKDQIATAKFVVIE